MASFRILRPWSVHGGVSHASIRARGIPNPDNISPLLADLVPGELDDAVLDGVGDPDGEDARLGAQAITVRFASDVRFDERHGLVVQLSAMPWAKAGYDLGSSRGVSILGIDRALEYGGPVPLAVTYDATLSYQLTFDHLDLRLGGGWSAVPFAWLLQANEFGVRFGGPANRAETRARRALKRAAREATERLPADAPPPSEAEATPSS
jgi:hypothetical protein